MARRFNGRLFGQLLSERKVNGKPAPISLSEAARQIGVSRSMVRDWINEKRQPTLENADAAAALVGYSLDLLMVEDPGPAPSREAPTPTEVTR